LIASVRLGGAVAGAGPVEVGEHVGGALVQGAAEAAELDQRCRDAVAEGVDDGSHRCATGRSVGVTVGKDHPLQDPPGRFDLDMVGVGEQGDKGLFVPEGGVIGVVRRR